jgi:hypothetical protein
LVKTSLLRNEQTPPTQVIENNKEEIKTEGSASSLEKGTSTVSGLIITKFDKLCIE